MEVIMNKFFHLSEIIDVDVLQKIQNYYSEATGLAVVTVDYMGNPITKFSNFSKYCSLIRKDAECNEKCCHSDAHGGLEAARIGKPYIYTHVTED
jgi:ligand-binding sensor protein